MNVRKKSEKATVVLNYIKVLKYTLVNFDGSVIDQCNQILVNECDLTMAEVYGVPLRTKLYRWQKHVENIIRKSKLVKYTQCNQKYEWRFAKRMFTNEKKKTRVEILKLESKEKNASRVEKKKKKKKKKEKREKKKKKKKKILESRKRER